MARVGKVRVLVVDNDKQRVEVFQRCLSADFDVVEARPGASASMLLESEDFDLLVSDKRGRNGHGASNVEFVGSCPSTRSMLDTIERFAREEGDVLVLGEAGSGKARVARALHQASARGGAFLCLRLAELEPDQIDAAIFDEGLSRSMHAEGGTLLIDGIEAMPLTAQARLVEERNSLWRGWRIVFASASSEQVSPVLLSSLAQREIRVSPLRDRGEDIPGLAIHFVARASKSLGRKGISLGREAMAELCVHNWPGNVSELREVIERAVPRCADMAQIGAGLIDGASAIVVQVVDDIIGGSRGLDAAMAELEAAVIREALQQQHGNRSAAARQLKLPRQTLQDRMKKHGLWQS